jgi:hypothetical protein
VQYLRERDDTCRITIITLFSEVMHHKISSMERGIDKTGSLEWQCRLQSPQKRKINSQRLKPFLELITADPAQGADLWKAGAERLRIRE